MQMVNDRFSNAMEHSQRGNVYRLLAECYRYPTIELNNSLQLLANETQNLDPKLGKWGQQTKNRFDPSESGLAQMGVAYAKLFIGPFQLLAAPYGSVYLDENRRAMGDSTMRVIQFYIDAGLHPSEDNKEPPDHISTELEFVYYLAFRHLETGEVQFLEKQRQFLLTEMSTWVPEFTSAIVKSRLHPFYSSLASLTNEFIQWEVNWLKQRQ